MKDTQENRRGLEALCETARQMQTGYQIELCEDYYNEAILTLRIKTPHDTDDTAYPKLYIRDDWYGEKAICFEICTVGYGDSSLHQAQRAMHGLHAAISLVTALYKTAQKVGLPVHGFEIEESIE